MVLPLKLTDLPDSFPVFPLGGALLLPQGRLPLNVFEPRYLAMIEDCLGQGRYLGMIQPDKRLLVGASGPGLYRIGCLGRITSFEETTDKQYLITLTGVCRFTVIEEATEQRGYRRVHAGLSGFADDLTPDAPLVFPFLRQNLLDVLHRYFVASGIEANWDAINEMETADLLTSLCMVCPFTIEEKQALLEAKTTALRAEALKALLEIHSFGGGASPSSKPIIN